MCQKSTFDSTHGDLHPDNPVLPKWIAATAAMSHADGDTDQCLFPEWQTDGSLPLTEGWREDVSPVGQTLNVPGARLYYEVQGSGPVLMLVGHPMGISGFGSIAPLLSEDYTLVTYDPRGFARSPIDDPDQDAAPDLLADDVRRVLEAVGDTPASVFGSSGGAVTALALATHYSGHVRTIVAHEPPLALLLSDAGEARAELQELYDTYRSQGMGAAWQRFAVFSGLGMPSQGEDSTQPPSAEAVATSERFFLHGLLPIALYQPDLSALQRTTVEVVVAGGTTSKGQFPQRTALALAKRLGTALIDFPGGHDGFASDPREFAAVLRRVLA